MWVSRKRKTGTRSGTLPRFSFLLVTNPIHRLDALIHLNERAFKYLLRYFFRRSDYEFHARLVAYRQLIMRLSAVVSLISVFCAVYLLQISIRSVCALTTGRCRTRELCRTVAFSAAIPVRLQAEIVLGSVC